MRLRHEGTGAEHASLPTQRYEMKKNLSVTQREIDYSEADVFVTKTDQRGVITYANDSFVHISGFTREELVGENHNVVRHPDMPQWVFSDLWQTVMSGHPWRGIVKNRAKNGDHYWVRATVSPVVKDGHVAGYLSLRKKPTRTEISAAEMRYKADKSGSGLPMLHRFKNLPLQTKLQILIQPMLLVLLGIGNVFIYQQIKATIMHAAELRAEATAMQVIDGANMLMVTGAISDTKNRSLLIDKIIEGQHLESLRLVRTDEVAKQYGPGLPGEHLDDPKVSQVVENSASQGKSIAYLALEHENGKPVFRAITPYINSRDFHGTDCTTCHKGGSVNGASDIRIDMSAEFRQLDEVMIGLVAGQVVLQLLLFLFMRWVIRHFVERPVEEIKTHLNDLVNGDMSSQVDISGRDEMGEILCSVQSAKVLLGEIIDQIGSVSDHIDARARELTQTMANVARGSRTQSEAASDMAAAIEEMTVSIDQVAENAGEVRRVSINSKSRADEGGNIVRQVVGDMGRINQAVTLSAQKIRELDAKSSHIRSIVETIREIADQTNLLALNAAIEAARAGEQGRGFAVVADEVRSLAEKTGRATQEIAEMIDQIRTGTSDAAVVMASTVEMAASGSALAGKAGLAIVAINEDAGQVLHGVEDISASIKEQSVASRDISVNVEKVAQMSEENSASVQQVSGAVENLEKLASELEQSVGHFKV